MCWGALVEFGLYNRGNWAPGAVVEYLKTTPNFIALFISVAALVLSTVALLRLMAHKGARRRTGRRAGCLADCGIVPEMTGGYPRDRWNRYR